MNANEKIATRRRERGLTAEETASQIDLPIDFYEDIEKHPTELYALIKLNSIKRLCAVLELDVFDLLQLPCAFCEEGLNYSKLYSLPRNKVIRGRKMQLNLSDEKFAQRVTLNLPGVLDMQADEQFLESWPIYAIEDLATATRIPPQILMGVKCGKCAQ